MAGETHQIRRDIEATRQEIDQHLEQLGGQVRAQLDVQRQARENLPQILTGAALLGLAAGILFGGAGRRSREIRMLAREQERLAREWRRLGRRGRRGLRPVSLAELEEPLHAPDVP